MRLYNLRLEKDVTIGQGCYSRVICDVETNFCKETSLYFYVENRYADWLTYDVYDAFLCFAVYPAMYYGEDITIEGNVSKKLWFNLTNYIMHAISAYTEYAKIGDFKKVNVSVGGFANAQKATEFHVGTGFSGGVDSFCTIVDRFINENDPDYKIDSLFFFHVGQYGDVRNPLSWTRARNRFRLTRDFADEIGVPAIYMETNLFDFYKPAWEYSAGVLIRIASVLIFQRALKRYYISSAITYTQMVNLKTTATNPDLAEFSDPYIMPLLSPEGIEIVDDGEQYSRNEKVLKIASHPIVQKYLNVCINVSDDHVNATNCGRCGKCKRTLIVLDAIDALEQFSGVFNIGEWKKIRNQYKREIVYLQGRNAFAKEAVTIQRQYGKRLPCKAVASTYVVTNFIHRCTDFANRKIKKNR